MSYYFDNIIYSNIYPIVTAKLNSDSLDNTGWESLRQHNKDGSDDRCIYKCPPNVSKCHCSEVSRGNPCNFPSCDTKPKLFRTEHLHCTSHHTAGCHLGYCDKKKVYGDLWGSCGVFDPIRICTVKSIDSPTRYGRSTGEPPIRDVDWYTWKDGDQPPDDKLKAGWARCVYDYDISLVSLNDYESNKAYSYFLNSMAVGTNSISMFGGGLNNDKNENQNKIGKWLCKISLFSLPVNLWFQELYEKDHFDYSDINGIGLKQKRDDIFDMITVSYNNVLNSLHLNVFPDDAKSCSITHMSIPTFQMNLDSFNMNIPLSYSQYQVYRRSKDKSGVVSNYIQFMLNDSNSSFASGSNNKLKNIIPGFDILSEEPVSVNVMIIDPSTLTLSCMANPIDYKDYITNSKYKNSGYMAVSLNISVKITKWTAMLATLALLTLSEQQQLPESISNHIVSDTGFLPLKTYLQDCGDTITSKGKCLDYVRQYCSLQTFIPPLNFKIYTIFNALFIGDVRGGGGGGGKRVNVCQCYNSLLQPVIGRRSGNTTAMCFDKSCDDPAVKQLFSLDDELCSSKCSEIYSWLYNSDPSGPNAGSNPFWLDKGRYDSLCGQNYSPLIRHNINYSLLVYGMVICIGVLLILYGILYMYKVSVVNKIITMVSVSFILIGILTVLLIVMIGESSCGRDNKTPTCKSKIFGWKIPKDFCNYMSECECQTDNDCEGDCSCISQICVPNTGDYQKSTQTEYQHTNYWKLCLLGVILVICIGLFVLSLYIFDDALIGICGLSLAVTCIFAALIPVFTKKISVKYGNVCDRKES